MSDVQTIRDAGNNHWGTYATGSANTDWFQVFYGSNVPSHNHNVSVSGGTDRLNYRVSGSFQNTKRSPEVRKGQDEPV